MNFDELVKRDKGRNIKAELEQSMAEMRKLQQPKKNLKIPVENNLDEIVRELERLGFRCVCKSTFGVQTITTWSSGHYHEVGLPVSMINNGELTTLAELKEM